MKKTIKTNLDVVRELNADGYSIISSVFNIEECDLAKEELNGALKDNRVSVSEASKHAHNFFLLGNTLRQILFGSKMQKFHKEILGVNNVLRNAVASNIQRSKASSSTDFENPIGSKWHRDTPQFQGLLNEPLTLGSGVTFQVIVALDDTDSTNCTKVLRGSHLEKGGHRIDENSQFFQKYECKDLILKKGDCAIIDDNTFHKAGNATKNSRWLLFCSYTPWFVKPYFEYSRVILNEMSKYESHCLHQTSTPPSVENKIKNTLQPNDWYL